MPLVALKEDKTIAFTNSNVGGTVSDTVKLLKGVGVSHMLMRISLTPVGLGTFTVDPRFPFGMIQEIRIKDQSNNILIAFTDFEAAMMSWVFTKTNPYRTWLYNDGSNGWVYPAAATDVATAEEVRGQLTLPARVGAKKNITEFNVEIDLVATETKGWLHVGNFATSSTSITGNFKFTPYYDSGMNHTFTTYRRANVTIGTSLTSIGELPRQVQLRQILAYLPDFYDTDAASTDDEWLIEKFEYHRNVNDEPLRYERAEMIEILQDTLDVPLKSVDARLGNIGTDSPLFSIMHQAMPDTIILNNSEIRFQNVSSQTVSTVLLLVEDDPGEESQVRLTSAAFVKNLLREA